MELLGKESGAKACLKRRRRCLPRTSRDVSSVSKATRLGILRELLHIAGLWAGPLAMLMLRSQPLSEREERSWPHGISTTSPIAALILSTPGGSERPTQTLLVASRPHPKRGRNAARTR